MIPISRLFALGLPVAGGAALALFASPPPAARPTAAPAPAAAPRAARAVGRPVAVELFTSQGCSSCPPADALLARLAADPGIVAMTRPVTYWDRLGWRDTLARPANTDLQRAYAARAIPGAGVYTPQIVIDGRTGFVGGRGDQITPAIDRARRTPAPVLGIAGGVGDGRVLTLGGGAPVRASIVLVALRRSAPVAIRGGENAGRMVRYTNVLVSETPLGTWSCQPARIAVPARALRVAGADRYAVLVRAGAAGPILAARYL